MKKTFVSELVVLLGLFVPAGVVSASSKECTPGFEWGKKPVVNVMMVYEEGIPFRQFYIENYSDNMYICDQFTRFINSKPGAPVHFCQPSYIETCIPTAETRKGWDEILKKNAR